MPGPCIAYTLDQRAVLFANDPSCCSFLQSFRQAGPSPSSRWRFIPTRRVSRIGYKRPTEVGPAFRVGRRSPCWKHRGRKDGPKDTHGYAEEMCSTAASGSIGSSFCLPVSPVYCCLPVGVSGRCKETHPVVARCGSVPLGFRCRPHYEKTMEATRGSPFPTTRALTKLPRRNLQ